MKPLAQLSVQERQALHQQLSEQHSELKAQGLSLDMTRGKPSTEQLDLANALLSKEDYIASDGTDCRNYGGLDGLPEMKALFAQMLETDASNIIVGGNSSLTLMHDALVRACLHGTAGVNKPWVGQEKRFLCPSPGYDRHFLITETLGFELVPVAMTDHGPDMDEVEALVAKDASIKGIWCVPKYSNPTGATYSNEVVNRLAKMPCAAPDFTIMWDNAYAEHHLDGNLDKLQDIISTCAEMGYPNRPLAFASTSKISFGGSGVACLASSEENIVHAKKHISVQSIGPDKLNQLRHVRFYKNLSGVRQHMKNHAAVLKPKFDEVGNILQQQLASSEVASWTRPRGGYFISLDMQIGSAKRAIELSDQIGVKLTGAGAPFPYGHDPLDGNIRIAPSFPSLSELRQATQALALCVKLAAVEASLDYQ